VVDDRAEPDALTASWNASTVRDRVLCLQPGVPGEDLKRIAPRSPPPDRTVDRAGDGDVASYLHHTIPVNPEAFRPSPPDLTEHRRPNSGSGGAAEVRGPDAHIHHPADSPSTAAAEAGSPT